MNAITALPSFTTQNLPVIPVGRFEPLSISASSVAELLQPIDDRNARECYARLLTIQPRLQAERLAAERGLLALTAAKAEMRRIDDISSTIIDTAVRVGRLFNFDEIADFENQDDAWLLTIEGLVSAFRQRGPLGTQFADRFTEVLVESRAAASELNRARAEYARATAAFSTEYRALSAAVAFGRAVLAELGVEMPRVTPKKKAKAEPVQASAPTPPMAAPVQEPV